MRIFKSRKNVEAKGQLKILIENIVKLFTNQSELDGIPSGCLPKGFKRDSKLKDNIAYDIKHLLDILDYNDIGYTAL